MSRNTSPQVPETCFCFHRMRTSFTTPCTEGDSPPVSGWYLHGLLSSFTQGADLSDSHRLRQNHKPSRAPDTGKLQAHPLFSETGFPKSDSSLAAVERLATAVQHTESTAHKRCRSSSQDTPLRSLATDAAAGQILFEVPPISSAKPKEASSAEFSGDRPPCSLSNCAVHPLNLSTHPS